MQTKRKTHLKIFLSVVACILLYWGLNDLSSVSNFFRSFWNLIGPFVSGAAAAFILNIPVKAIETYLLPKIPHKGVRRGLSITLALLFVFLIILLVLLLVIPQLKTTILSIVNEMPSFVSGIQAWVTDWLANRPEIEQWITRQFGEIAFDWAGITAKLSSWLSNLTVVLMNGIFSFAGSIVGGIVSSFIAFIFSIYALFRKEILARQARMLLYSFLPEKRADRILYISTLSNRVFGNFLSGQCLEACILGCLFAITMLIFRMPYIPLISILIAVSALIPVVGAFAGCIVGTLLILVDDPLKALWFLILFLILQQLEGNLIYPKVVGNSVGLPSMWVLVAVALGANLMGILGMLVMIPAVSVLYTLMREITYRKISEKNIPTEKISVTATLTTKPKQNNSVKTKSKRQKESATAKTVETKKAGSSHQANHKKS